MMLKNKRLSSWGTLVCGLTFAAMGAVALSLGRRFDLMAQTGAAAQAAAPAAVQTAVLLLLMFSMGAIPIFAVLLVDGFGNGENFKHSLVGLCLLALISELPFNLAMTGKVFSLQVQNPVFALVLCELLLFVYHRSAGKGFVSALIAIAATVAGIFICSLAGLMEYGMPLLLATWVVWTFRRRNGTRVMAALLGSLICALLGIAYLTAPIGVLAIQFYDGEKSDKKYLPLYLAYPVILLVSYGISFLF